MENKTSLLQQRSERFLDTHPQAINNIIFQDVKMLVEDLHRHQIELSIQNEELRNVQLELEASRDRYATLYDLAPVGYITDSEKGFILQANLACADMLGVDIKSLIGQPFSRFIHKYDRELFYFHRKSLLETKAKQVCELKLLRKDGTEFYAQLESIVLKDIKFKIIQTLTTVININERKMAEKALLKAYGELERKVKERTAELTQTNRELKRAIEARKRTEKQLRKQQKRTRMLSCKVIETQENERRHVAKEIHDSVACNLAAIKLILEQKLAPMNSSPRNDIYSLEKVIADIKDTIEEVRRISNHLMPYMLVDQGLVKTIRCFCQEQAKYHHNIRIFTRLEIDEAGIHELLKVTIFRVIQEAMTNSLKHGRPDTIQLSLVKAGDRIELCVMDDGCGFDTRDIGSKPDSLNGFGLRVMNDRAEICNGTFEISSEIGKGTQVKLSLPYR